MLMDIAMLVGYNGMGYYGWQFNEGVKTVESQLYKALHSIGMIKDDNYNNLNKVCSYEILWLSWHLSWKIVKNKVPFYYRLI